MHLNNSDKVVMLALLETDYMRYMSFASNEMDPQVRIAALAAGRQRAYIFCELATSLTQLLEPLPFVVSARLLSMERRAPLLRTAYAWRDNLSYGSYEFNSRVEAEYVYNSLANHECEGLAKSW